MQYYNNMHDEVFNDLIWRVLMYIALCIFLPNTLGAYSKRGLGLFSRIGLYTCNYMANLYWCGQCRQLFQKKVMQLLLVKI